MGTLFIVATPIGNLEDITLRALRILKEVAVVFAEDTRVTRKLFFHYTITTPLESYHQHSSEKTTFRIAELLRSGKNVAVVTDAGTPGISDPGNELIARLCGILGPDVPIVPVPGPNAAVTLASVSGLPTQEFIFLGYPPAKKARKKFFERLALFEDMPKILYESPYRLDRTLSDIAASCGPEARIVVGRELTKKFETIFRGAVQEARVRMSQKTKLGEFTLIVY